MNSTDHTESSGESEQKRNAYSAYRKNLNERHNSLRPHHICRPLEPEGQPTNHMMGIERFRELYRPRKFMLGLKVRETIFPKQPN